MKLLLHKQRLADSQQRSFEKTEQFDERKIVTQFQFHWTADASLFFHRILITHITLQRFFCNALNEN